MTTGRILRIIGRLAIAFVTSSRGRILYLSVSRIVPCDISGIGSVYDGYIKEVC